MLLLARHFVSKHAPAGPHGEWAFEPEAIRALQAYDWPGNVRELENLIQQLLALTSPGRIGIEMLPDRFQVCRPAPSRTLREAKAQAVAAFERDYASRLLSVCDGNVSHAARAAGKDRRAFGRLVKKYGLK